MLACALVVGRQSTAANPFACSQQQHRFTRGLLTMRTPSRSGHQHPFAASTSCRCGVPVSPSARPAPLARPQRQSRSAQARAAEDVDIQVFRFTLGIPGFDDSNIPRVVGCLGALLLVINHNASTSIADAQVCHSLRRTPGTTSQSGSAIRAALCCASAGLSSLFATCVARPPSWREQCSRQLGV